MGVNQELHQYIKRQTHMLNFIGLLTRLLQQGLFTFSAGIPQRTDHYRRRRIMKLLWILAALLSFAYCDDGETCTSVYVTGDDGEADCTCTCTCEQQCNPLAGFCWGGKTGQEFIDTYDENRYELLTANKFLMSTGGFGDDQCKFQVRVDTKKNKDGTFKVDWIGVGFGVHNGDVNGDKFDRNFRVSLRHLVEIRGRGFKNPKPAAPDTNYATGPIPEAPETWSFMYTIEPDGAVHIRGEVPALGCSFDVWYWEGKGPQGNDVVKIRPPLEYLGELRGICGDFNGVAEDDHLVCPGSTGDVADVSDACIDGKHQDNDSKDR